MATITSTASGNTTTYVITDQYSNTLTIVAGSPGAVVSLATSGSGVANDALKMASNLLFDLAAGGPSPRPQVLVNTTASFSS